MHLLIKILARSSIPLFHHLPCASVLFASILLPSLSLAEEKRVYENRLTRIQNPKPLLNDHPLWVEPIRDTNRYEAPILVDDKEADLHVRAWRFSYNARGIIEMP